MSNDLDQFHSIFFEESFEGLDDMESGLLGLEPGSTDMEAINSIFRVAHSVKGGSGMFGFTEITGLTHIMETLLDEMRDSKREVNKPGVDLLLRSVDCLRDMLETQKNGNPQDPQQTATIQQQLEAMLSGTSAVANAETDNDAGPCEPDATGEAALVAGWQITFHPYPEMLTSGNDPVLMFKVLEMLGPVSALADLSKLPKFADLKPEQCMLGWELTLQGDVHLDEVSEVFDWVEGDCDLEITALASQPATATVESGDESPCEEEITATTATVQSVTGQTQIQDSAPPAVDEQPTVGNDRRQNDRRSAAAPESATIRVNIDKIDALINMVGELVITRSMLGRFHDDASDLEGLRDGLDQLERNTRELQESVMQIRMLPISFSFNRFPRLVRDTCSALGKQAELVMVGEQTEVDKTVLEKIADPLVHLVRNSLDHGLETPEVRLAADKPECGTLQLKAFHEGGNIVIEISDDGGGLNREKILEKAREKGLVGDTEEIPDQQIYNLIFQPGFSTADTVSDLSGRGVGMDVVRRNIRDLGGSVSIDSTPGQGSRVTIRLPLTMAILDGQLIKVGNQTYVVSLVSIIESLQISPDQLNKVSGQAELFKLRDEYIPVIRLHQLLGVPTQITAITDGLLVVVEGDNRKVALFVDDLHGQQQVVIKSLETNFQQVQGVSGATILGDGQVALILDVAGLIHTYFEQTNNPLLPTLAAA